MGKPKINHIEAVCNHAFSLNLTVKEASEAGLTLFAQACVAMADDVEGAVQLVRTGARDAETEVRRNYAAAKEHMQWQERLDKATRAGKPS